jgi:hypothetical protein
MTLSLFAKITINPFQIFHLNKNEKTYKQKNLKKKKLKIKFPIMLLATVKTKSFFQKLLN